MSPATEDHPPGPGSIGARRGWPLMQRLREPDSFGLLLMLVLVDILAGAFANSSFLATLVVGFQVGVLAFAMWTSRAPRRLVIAFGIGFGVALAAGLASVVAGGASGQAVRGIASVILSLAAIVAVVRRVVAHPVVDGATILGALCVYLLLGLFFASVYGAVAAIGSGPLFAQALGDGAAIDRTYFSFVTLSTVGYGDLSARADVARMLAVSEALLGQIYLVTVVALLIGNVGRQRRPADRDAS